MNHNNKDSNPADPVLVDLQKCDLCGGCIAVCPPNCIEMSERSLRIIGSECIRCGFCIPVCPLGALEMTEEVKKVQEDKK